MAHITTRLVRGYLDSNVQETNEMGEAISMIKHLLISVINDESIVVLADALRSIIVARGLPHCLSFEVPPPRSMPDPRPIGQHPHRQLPARFDDGPQS